LVLERDIRMTRFYDVQAVRVDDAHLYLVVDGQACRVPLRTCSPRLKAARQADRDA
jgi:hypothetical protein